MSSGRIGRIGAGLFDAEKRWPDAQAFMPDAEYVKKGAEFSSLTGVAMTHLGNGDIFYAVDTTAGAVTVTLPAVAGTVGQTHIVKRISGGSNACNIVAEEGTAILDGSATHSIAAQYGVRCYFSDGVAWRGTLSPASLPLEGTWQSYSVTSSAATGAFTDVTSTGKYLQTGKTVAFFLQIAITTNGTAATGINSSLPVTPANAAAFAGNEVSLVGEMVSARNNTGSTGVVIQRYDTAYPGGSGRTIIIRGVYEAA